MKKISKNQWNETGFTPLKNFIGKDSFKVMNKYYKGIKLSSILNSSTGFTPLKNFIGKDSFKVMNKYYKGIKLSSILNSSTGFTLIELMIATAMTLFVLAGVFEAFTSQKKAYIIQDQVAEMQQNARVALDMMTREIRMAGYLPEKWDVETDPTQPTSVPTTDVTNFDATFTADANADDIVEMGAAAITFKADVDGDDKTETVRYSLSRDNLNFLSGDNLNLLRESSTWDGTSAWSGSSGQDALAENIVALSFKYYDSSGAVATTPSSIRLIQIQLTARTARKDLGSINSSGFINSDTNYGHYRTRILTAYVRPRNLGL